MAIVHQKNKKIGITYAYKVKHIGYLMPHQSSYSEILQQVKKGRNKEHD